MKRKELTKLNTIEFRFCFRNKFLLSDDEMICHLFYTKWNNDFSIVSLFHYSSVGMGCGSCSNGTQWYNIFGATYYIFCSNIYRNIGGRSHVSCYANRPRHIGSHILNYGRPLLRSESNFLVSHRRACLSAREINKFAASSSRLGKPCDCVFKMHSFLAIWMQFVRRKWSLSMKYERRNDGRLFVMLEWRW